jgi:drug/metabolite transporter (DMT)-like permease
LIGEICALICAFCWALSSTLTKSVTGKFQPANLNLLRCLAASAFFWAIIPFSPGTKGISQTPLIPVLYLVSSALIGIVVGDSLYFRGLKLINVTLAFPLTQAAMPLATLGIAVLFLGETITWIFVLGTLLVLGGICLIISPEGRTRRLLRARVLENRETGLFLMLIASALWAVSISLVKVGIQEVNILVANGIRLPIACLLLSLFLFLPGAKPPLATPGFRDLSLGAFSGVLGFGVGGIFFLLAIQNAGAGKAAVLTSSAPVFGLPLSVVFLKEKVTPKTIFGTLLVVLGILFLVC